MFRIFFSILLFCSLLFSSDIAIVKNLTGNVFAKRGQNLERLLVGSNVLVGDVLITKSNSSIGIIFQDGTLLSLGQNSILKINQYIFEPFDNKYDFDIDMKKGLSAFESGTIGKLAPQSVKFRVPEGIVGIRGTKFYVEVK